MENIDTTLIIILAFSLVLYILNLLSNNTLQNVREHFSNQIDIEPNGGTVQFGQVKNLGNKPVIMVVYYADKEGKIQTSGKNRIIIVHPNEIEDIEGLYEKDTTYLLGALTEDGGLNLELKGELRNINQKILDNNLVYASFMGSNYNRNKIKTENDKVKIDKPGGTKQQTFISISGEII